MDRRKENRSQTRESIRARIAGVDVALVMRNLSQSGCRVDGGALPGEVGAQVSLELLPGLTVEGEVAWQLGESMGIFFLKPIPLAVVQGFALDDWPLRSDWSRSGR